MIKIKLHSIKAKIAAVMIICAVLSLGMLGTLNYFNAKQMLLSDGEDIVKTLAVDNADKLGLWVEMRKAEMHVLANSPVVLEGNKQAILNYLAAESKRNPIYLRFLIVDNQGNAAYTNGSTANLNDRVFWQKAMKGEANISDPVVSKIDGKMVSVVAVPIKVNNQVVGMLGGTVTVDDLIKYVLEIKVGQTGYAYLVRQDGLTIIHPDKELVMKYNALTDANANADIKAMVQSMTKKERGIIQYNSQGGLYYGGYAPIPGTDWSLGISVPVSELTTKLNSLTVTSVVTGVIIILLAILVSIAFARYLVRPLNILNKYAKQFAQGDLSDRNLAIATRDEIGEVAGSFKLMADSLHGLIKKVSQSAKQVAASSEELTASAEQAAQASTQVAGSVLQVAQGVEKQSAAVERTLEQVHRMSAHQDKVALIEHKAAAIAEKTAKATNEGKICVDKAVSQMDNVGKGSLAVQEAINELTKGSTEISEIVELISSIAGQTNLLALNAAIEAARAGEHGRGFAVVAEEVRKLAEQSEQAAKKITQLISQNEVNMQQAVNATKINAEGIKAGIEIVNFAGTTFKEIAASVEELSMHIEEISTAMQELNEGAKKIITAVDDIDKVSKDNAAETQSVSAATEEQSASMQEISASSQTLSNMANDLLNAVSRFKV